MSRKSSSLFSRRLLAASIIFGLFVLFDILLFGFLIFRSLSQREIDRVLLETRAEAKDLAQRIVEKADSPEKDLFLVMVSQKEVQRYIDSELAQRDLVEAVEIYDREGSLVYQRASRKHPEPGLEPGEISNELLKSDKV